MVRLIGLNRLFSSGRSRPSDLRTPEASHGTSSNMNSRRKPKGFFSQLGDDDEFEMIPEQKTKGSTWTAEPDSRVSHDTDGSTESRKNGGLGAIQVRREFEVSSTQP